MKLILFTSYFTINTAFLFLLDFFSLNQHRNHVQIFISILYIAAAAILHRNPTFKFLRDEILISPSPPSRLQAPTPSPDHGRETVDNCSDDRETSQYKRIHEFGDGGYEYDHERERCWLCGYEGDDEDEEYEDEDLSKKIEEFINGRKREWREEMIKERLLFMEGAKL